MVTLDSYKDLYFTTAKDHIAILKKNIVILKTSTDDAGAKEQMLLHSHSFKSQNMIMGYPQMGEVCKNIEQIFRELKDGKRVLNNLVLTHIENALSKLSKSLTNIRKINNELDFTDEIESLKMNDL